MTVSQNQIKIIGKRIHYPKIASASEMRDPSKISITIKNKNIRLSVFMIPCEDWLQNRMTTGNGVTACLCVFLFFFLFLEGEGEMLE